MNQQLAFSVWSLSLNPLSSFMEWIPSSVACGPTAMPRALIDRISSLSLHPVGKVIWIIPLFYLYIFRSVYWLLYIVGRILIGIILDMWHDRGELISIWFWVHENKYPSRVIDTILNVTHLCFIVFSTQILLKLLTLFISILCVL